MKISYFSVLAIALFCLSACDFSSRDQTAIERETIGTSDQLMTVISLADWETVRRQYLGNILVVDYWASWCVSCIERFPAMVDMSQRFHEQGVQFISLNLDDPTDEEALAWSNQFLEKMQAEFPHYHLQENLMHSFEQLDLLGIPVVMLYDGQGKERYRLTGDNPNQQFGDDDVERSVIALLAERQAKQ